MTPLLALAVVFLVYAVGDMIAVKTKAIISMMLVGCVVFMIAFWCGLPSTIFTDSGLIAFSSVTICMFLVHIGSTINLRQFVDEWRMALLVLCTTLVIAFGTYLICQFLIDRNYALAGSPVLAGGVVAYLIMGGAAEAAGLSAAAVFALMILCLQNFVGIPIASTMCKKEGLRILGEWKKGTYVPEKEKEKAGEQSKHSGIFPPVPEKYNGANLILLKVTIIALIAYYLGQITGVNQLIFALILGVVCRGLGILDEDALTKANGFAFVLAGALCSIFTGLANTTPQMVVGMLPSVLILIVVGVILMIAAALIAGRVLHVDWQIAIATAVTALFGFPGTYLVSREVSVACGENKEEVQIVMDYIMPKMIIAGIVSVSIVSGLAASVMCLWMVG